MMTTNTADVIHVLKMVTKPSVLILSCSSTKPASLIKLITKQSVEDPDSDLISQPWTISTKYYTSEIDVMGFNGTPDSFLPYAMPLATVEAVIIHFNANKANGLEDVAEWTQLVHDFFKPEVKLLLTNYCNDSTAVSKQEANLCCLDNGFELIELFPEDQNESNDDDDFCKETVGIDRVIEALHNNLWSNMITHHNTEAKQTQSEQENDQFLDLFSNLHAMKSSISSLPSSARKQSAEQMVTAFWKAIGGDDEELQDL